MINREKVIKGTEICLSGGKPDRCRSCPYHLDGCDRQRMQDTLALLKEQEARKPHYTTMRYLVNGMEVAIQHPECPRCIKNGLVLWDAELEKGQAYCKRCGQAVKWDD